MKCWLKWNNGRRARLRRCIPLWISMRCGFRFGMKGASKTRPCILALWIRADGCREVLGLWTEQTAGAKFWLKVFNDAQEGAERYSDYRRRWTARLSGRN